MRVALIAAALVSVAAALPQAGSGKQGTRPNCAPHDLVRDLPYLFPMCFLPAHFPAPLPSSAPSGYVRYPPYLYLSQSYLQDTAKLTMGPFITLHI